MLTLGRGGVSSDSRSHAGRLQRHMWCNDWYFSPLTLPLNAGAASNVQPADWTRARSDVRVGRWDGHTRHTNTQHSSRLPHRAPTHGFLIYLASMRRQTKEPPHPFIDWYILRFCAFSCLVAQHWFGKSCWSSFERSCVCAVFSRPRA